MKKVICVILSVLLISTAFCGCSSDKKDSGKETNLKFTMITRIPTIPKAL